MRQTSYPPRLWGADEWNSGTGTSSPHTPPTGADPTGASAGAPGSFTPPGSTVPADLTALQALGDLGQTTAWAGNEYVVLGDGSSATWDGSDWAVWTAPTNVYPDTVVAGSPGTFSNAAFPTATVDIPDDLATLQGLGDLGQTTAWTTGQYVDLGDASTAHWDGSAWAVDAAPAPPPPPPGDVIIVPDPGSMTVAEAKAWIDALPHNGHGHDAVQEMLELERAGQNRATLVDWLDAKLGAI